MAERADQCALIASLSLDGFIVNECDHQGQSCLIIQHRKLYNHPPFGPTPRCVISVSNSDSEYRVHILMREVERGSLLDSPVETILAICKKYNVSSSTHKFCPGLPVSECEEYKAIIRFDLKRVCNSTEPFLRNDSTSGQMWFQLSKSSSNERKEADSVLCPKCVRLRCDLKYQAK
jgi:hypothetical protein